MNIIKGIITLFIVAVGVMCVLGIIWWGNPPEKLANYTIGGQVILGITIVGCFVGLYGIWSHKSPELR